MNAKVFIFILLEISVSFSLVCINVHQSCNNFANRCNIPKYKELMVTNCPQTCGVCVIVKNNIIPTTTVKPLTIDTNTNESPIGPCLNGMCPSGSVCIQGNCYTLKVQSTTSSGSSSSSNAICVDLVNACPRFVNSCGNNDFTMNVVEYCPMTCGVCFYGK
uniref:ShKT domain-containing protein n=1 Tax=Strongyloides venezuelensis TaxID=75913 RepID=A0A0K0FTV6_STRVS